MARGIDADRLPRHLVGGRFEALAILGEGGMGTVYRALDRERGVQVALKTLRGATPDSVLRFKSEFRALRDVRHPNLVELGELFESDGRWLFTMELVTGLPLLAWVSGEDAAPSGPSTDTAAATRVEVAPADLPTVITGKRDEASRPISEPLPSVRCDEARLRQAFAGLASGLAALHRAGKVHRDVKPSNVIVDESGRAVLLDFGIVAELWQARSYEERLIIGTASHMAPEQARGDAIGPPSDWYALGVVLFQALAGRLPITAPDPEAILLMKQHQAAPPIAKFVVGCAPELARLCDRLLQREPLQRPTEDEIFAALGAPRTDDDGAWMRQATEGRLFVGRREELAKLESALADSRRDAVFVEITGESGVGKSSLVRHFCELVRATHGKSLVLHGRCHERERLAFNAFDGIIDDLARWLMPRSETKIAAMVPRAAAELMLVFPDLRAVRTLDEIAATASTAGMTDLRGRAFGALRELLGHVGDRGPLVLVIDDLQWADDDSLALLDELVRMGGPRLLVIATTRGVEDRASHRRLPTYEVRRIELGGLAPDDSAKLVQLIDDGTADATQLIAESRGHPLFLAELVRHRSSSGATIRLDDAIWSRVQSLDAGSRILLASLAIAGAPLPRELVVAVSGLDAVAALLALDRLARDQMIRIHGPLQTDIVETFHDRVRGAVLAREDERARRGLHARLANLLELRGASPDTLFTHYDAAGDRAKAAQYLMVAAQSALRTFAFGRAVELFARALATLELEPAQRRDLIVHLADALANEGRTAEAGERYLEASKLAEPDSDHQLDLLRRAAERFLMSGRLAPGLETAKAVLARIDMVLPTSRARAIAGIVMNQLRTRNAALVWKPRAIEPDPKMIKIEVCWSMSAGLAMVDTLLGAYFSGHSVVLALRHGTALQIARSMSTATVGAALLGRRERATRIREMLERAAAEDGSPIAAWYGRLADTATSFVLDNDFDRCLAIASTLEQDWYGVGRGPGWETDVARHFVLAAQQMLGNLSAVAERATGFIESARRTGDLFSEVSLRVRFAVPRYLLSDRAEEARQDVVDALRSWQPSEESFGNQRAWALWSRTRIALYAGNLDRIADELGDEWERMRRSLVGRVPAMKVEWFHTYGTFLIARGIAARAKNQAREHAAMCRATERLSDELDGLDFPVARSTSLFLRAAVAHARGVDALGPLRAAIEEAGSRRFFVYVPFLRRRLGEVMGGTEGAAMIAAADADARASGFSCPERAAEMALPTGRFM